MDYGAVLDDVSFMNEEKPYRLALVHGGVKEGELVRAVDTAAWADEGIEYRGGADRDDIEAAVEALELPATEVSHDVPVAEEYGGGTLPMTGFYVAHDGQHLSWYEDEILSGGMDCRSGGSFEGVPDCCIDAYCPEDPETPEYTVGPDHATGPALLAAAPDDIDDRRRTVLSVLPELSHVPHSPDCEPSLQRGNRFLAFLEEEWPAAARWYGDLAADRMEEPELAV